MVTYKYTAISKGGTKVSGVIEGFNELDAVDRIKESCDVVLKLTPVKEKKVGFLNMEIGSGKLNSKAFTVMCSQFAIILKAGLPIARAVQLIADKTTNKPLKKILQQVGSDVEAGRTMAASFQERGGKLFPPTFVETIRAGEESGNLDKSFDSMYKHYDKQVKMKGKVKSALSYPIFVLIIAVVVVAVLMGRVVPTFTAIFESYGSDLPLITKILIAISNFFKDYSLVFFGVIALIFVGIKLYGNTENGRMNLAKLALKIPVLGNISELNAASQFANSMAAMLGAGLPMTRAVNITSKVIDNYYISTEVGKISGRLEEGRSLGDSMREAGCLPDILTDMTAVGEQSGEMEETLNTVAAYYDAELEMAITSALNKLEPATLVFIAVVAGFIVLAIYIAMFQMYSVM
ncbi:MAG: type II secretion system F family protein [Lachnospiraceae bacterium]|nr:type II secretion system F family protein [Lachnospiraceae bacterium]